MTKSKRRIVVVLCLMLAFMLALTGASMLIAVAATPGTVTYVTAEDMAADADNVLTDIGSPTKATVTADGITGEAGKLAYHAEV